MTSLPTIECPVCQAVCADPPLYRYTAERAASHFCPETRDADRYRRLVKSINKLWQGEDCVVVRCGECGFAFGHPFVGGDEEFYSILHEQAGYPNWRWDYDIAIERAVSCWERGNVLDIGAGSGMFLRRMPEGWQRFAVESSETMRRPLEEHGIQVFRDLAAAARERAGTFQVITLFQVLEHIAEFRETLQYCRRLLCTGGRLVVTVPDGDAMIRQERLTGCADMPPNHINKWTPDSLARVLREIGLEPEGVTPEPSSWRNLQGALYLRVIADAAENPRSLSAHAYKIKSKRLRAPVLTFLGPLALLRLLPYANQLRHGGAFATVGVARWERAV